MAARSPHTGATGMIRVRLSQVPPQKRLLVARRMIRLEGIIGIPALELLLAAERPRQNPSVLVPARLARRVLGA